MTLDHFVFGAAVLAVGVPSALRFDKLGWRDPTAGALVLCWITAEALAWFGKPLAVDYYLFPDIFAVAVIFHKVKRTRADWIVLLIYPLVWWTYAMPTSYSQWLLLWILAMAQFFAVGVESHPLLHHAGNASSDEPAPYDAFYRLAWGKAGDG